MVVEAPLRSHPRLPGPRRRRANSSREALAFADRPARLRRPAPANGPRARRRTPPRVPGWRNWQTRQTKDLVPVKRSAGSTPVPGTISTPRGAALERAPRPARLLRAGRALPGRAPTTRPDDAPRTGLARAPPPPTQPSVRLRGPATTAGRPVPTRPSPWEPDPDAAAAARRGAAVTGTPRGPAGPRARSLAREQERAPHPEVERPGSSRGSAPRRAAIPVARAGRSRRVHSAPVPWTIPEAATVPPPQGLPSPIAPRNP